MSIHPTEKGARAGQNTSRSLMPERRVKLRRAIGDRPRTHRERHPEAEQDTRGGQRRVAVKVRELFDEAPAHSQTATLAITRRS